MPRRPCLGCGVPTTGSRCADCIPHRPGSTARGYGRAHQRAAATAIEAEPWCHTLGGCPYPDAGTSANPLTGGHPRMRSDFGGDHAAWAAQSLIPQCARCNSGHAPLLEDR
jgi:hypothetical protein